MDCSHGVCWCVCLYICACICPVMYWHPIWRVPLFGALIFHFWFGALLIQLIEGKSKTELWWPGEALGMNNQTIFRNDSTYQRSHTLILQNWMYTASIGPPRLHGVVWKWQARKWYCVITHLRWFNVGKLRSENLTSIVFLFLAALSILEHRSFKKKFD